MNNQIKCEAPFVFSFSTGSVHRRVQRRVGRLMAYHSGAATPSPGRNEMKLSGKAVGANSQHSATKNGGPLCCCSGIPTLKLAKEDYSGTAAKITQ